MKKTHLNRRDFFRLSATAGVSTLLVPSASASISQTPAVKQEFEMRTLGRTGIRVPILSMGVMRADNPNVLRAAFNSGIFHFDTAHGYQNGKNEEMVGAFFKGKPRDTYCIATKVKFDYPLKDNFEEDFNSKLDLSLKRLQMDYVDIFYAHAYDVLEVVKEPRVLEALKKMKESGKVKYIGFSTHAGKPEQIDAAVEAGIYDVILLSYNFKLNNLKETQDAIDRAAKAGIGLVAMKTMTGGTEDADGKKKINAQACLKWAWQNPNIATIIPGFTNYDELEECLTAAQSPAITADEKEYLAGLKEKELLYCQQCGDCLDQCPQELPIPTLMRAYMYTYGYKQAQLSKEALAELELPVDACAGCDSCQVSCVSGFDVAKKIAAIAPVKNIPTEFLT